MMRTLSVTPTRRETCWAIAYLLAELLALPSVLAMLNSMLPVPLSAARLNLVFFAVNLGAVAMILRRFIARAFRTAGPLTLLATALVGLILYWVATYLVSLLITALDPDFSNVNDANIAGMVRQEFLLSVIGTVILAPPCEELLFRGVIFGGLYNRSRVAAYAVSALCFCAVHVVGYIGRSDPGTLALCFLQYIPAGLCLGWAYARSGGILAPIIMHSVINAIGLFIVR